jgi:hypothetical protein
VYSICQTAIEKKDTIKTQLTRNDWLTYLPDLSRSPVRKMGGEKAEEEGGGGGRRRKEEKGKGFPLM